MWIVVGIIVVAIIGLVYQKQSNQQSAKETIKIGILAPMTGGGAVFGNSLYNGVKLALADLKDTKYHYELVLEDDGTNPAQSVSGAQKLINIDKVKAILTTTSGTGNATAPLAETAKVVHICVCADQKVGTGQYNFTNSMIPNDEVEGWLNEAKKRGVKSVAILSQTHSGINAIVDALKAKAPEAGVNVLYEERFEGSVRDFKTMLSKAKQSNPEIYFIIAFPPALDILGQEIKNFDLGKPISTAAAFGISAKPELYEGYWYTDADLADESFRTRFEQTYPNIRFNVRTAPPAYDSFMLLVQGFEADKDIAEHIRNTTKIEGKVGVVTKTVESNNFRNLPGQWIIRNGRSEKSK